VLALAGTLNCLSKWLPAEERRSPTDIAAEVSRVFLIGLTH
jgi:hypothetical protein